MRNRERLQCEDAERTGGVDRGIEAVHRDRGPGLARRRKPLELGLVVGVALVLGMLSAIGAAVPFGTDVEYVTGVRPTSVTTGCFDDDAHLDLVVTNESDGTVSVFLGGGDGTFDAKVDFPAGVSPANASAGHFDDDGNLDLVVVNSEFSSTGGVSILLGDGDGGFTLAASYQTGFEPDGITTGDFDEDTRLDVAVAHPCSGICDLPGMVSILLGNGDGTFENGVPVTVAAAHDVSAGLFDDDQDLDLAVTAGGEDGNVVILLGNGDGTFAAPASYPAGLHPLRLTMGHFDDDTDLDVAVANFVGSTVSILLGNGDGSFAAPVAYPVAGPRPFALASGHFDDDLALDLAVANVRSAADPRDNTLSILHGNGDGTFGAPVDLEVGERPFAVTTGLFDDDTDVDLAVVNRNSNTVSILLDTVPEHSGSFALTAGSPFAEGGPPAIGYFDDDTDLDLAARSVTGELTILLGNGDGSFVEKVVYTPGFGPSWMTAGYFDDDTDVDLAFLLGQGFDSKVSILLGNGDGTFEPAPVPSFTAGFVVLALQSGHFDADADLDLVVLSRGRNSLEHFVLVFTGNGDGTFGRRATHIDVEPEPSMTAGDFDGDRHLDLAFLCSAGESMSILLGRGDGTFTDAGGRPVGMNAGYLSAGDFDGDADLDLAFAGFELDASNPAGYETAVSIRLGDGDGNFADPVQFPLPDFARTMTTGHFDGDANLDIAVAVAGFTHKCVSVLSGDGHGSFPKRIDYIAGEEPVYLTPARFDGNTSTDIVVSHNDRSLTMLLAFLDETAPTTSIALVPSAPDGANGWYVSPVAVSVTKTDDSASGVAETRYALDPPSAPATFGELLAGDPVTGVSGDGAHVLYAASVDWTGNQESPVRVDIGIDATPPTVTPDVAAPGPIFLLQGPGGSGSATVADATSQPAATSVSAPANVTSVGNKTVQLTGSDNAGNTTTVSAPYRVSYRFLGFLSPIPQTSFRRGSTIPVKFRLANAAGTRIPDAVAQALLAPVCRVKITLDGAVQTGCASYNATTDTFQFDLKVPRTIALGTHTVGIQVSAPDGSGVVNTDSTTVLIR